MRVAGSDRVKVAVASFGLLCCSVLLTAYSSRNPWVARIGTAAISEVVSPLYAGVDSVVDGGESMWDRYFNVLAVAERNRELTERLERLEAERGAFAERLKENDRLRKLLDLGSIPELQGISASVIANEPSGWVKGIVLNKGRAQGVLEGMAVVHPRGVVGQVVSASTNFSRVLLVTDHASGVDALVQDNRARGVVEGEGDSAAILNYVAKEYPVRVGDTIVTSGLDGVFPKGVIIGAVSQVSVESGTLLQKIAVRPAVDFSRLEEVLIIIGGQDKKDEAANMTKPLAQGAKERG